MGQAKQRGTFEVRKAQAISAGRAKAPPAEEKQLATLESAEKTALLSARSVALLGIVAAVTGAHQFLRDIE